MKPGSAVVDEGEVAVAVATLLRLDLLERSIAGDAYGELGMVELMESESAVVGEGEVAVATLLRLDLLERSIAGDAYGELGTVELIES
jgi:hypothetical protein